MNKELHVTFDFLDDTLNRHCEPAHVDRKLEYFASLGVTRADWMWDTWSLLYREPFGGEKNLLAYAAKKARALGIEVHALIKPFETGLAHLPHTFPQPPGMKIWRNLNGIFAQWVDPFLLEHPEMCFRRRSVTADPGGPIKTIKLVKAGTEPTRVKKEHVEIWTGDKNGRLERGRGEFIFLSGIESRIAFKPDQARTKVRQVRWLEERDCLVLTLGGLSIPESHRYVDIRCALSDGPGDFWNTADELVELYNEGGERIPSSPGWRNTSWKTGYYLGRAHALRYSEYGTYPEVRDFFADPERVREANRDNYFFPAVAPEHLDGGSACAARGGDEYLPILNPAYPEVRDYWLGVVEDCIECGVSGVNIRAASHSCYSAHAEEYGFNEPVLDHCGGQTNRGAAVEFMGDCWTRMLGEIKKRLADHALLLGVHINSGMVIPEGRDCLQSMPTNIEWQWRRWIEEGIPDYISLKDGAMLDTEARLELFIDRVARAAGPRGIPLVYLNPTGILRFAGENFRVGREMEMVARDGRLAAFNVYEAAAVTRFGADGDIEGSADLAALAAKHFPGLQRGAYSALTS